MHRDLSECSPTLGFIDTHAHLDDEAFDADRDRVIDQAVQAGVHRIVNVGYEPARWRTTSALRRRRSEVTAMFGLHPHHAEGWSCPIEHALRTHLHDDGAVAIGEIGLDYCRDGPDATLQRKTFRAQLELAMELTYPVVIHQRAAEKDLMTL